MMAPRLLDRLPRVPALVAGAGGARSQGATIIYTDLSPAVCETVRTDPETGDVEQRCPGVAGYSLRVHDADARQSVDVIAPGGARSPLQYTTVITTAFSSLGPRAEWRVRRRNGRAAPYALIVRVNAYEDPSNPERATSYLAVARINARGTCVTERIPPGANQNLQARQAADRAAGRPCLEGSAR